MLEYNGNNVNKLDKDSILPHFVFFFCVLDYSGSEVCD